MGESARGLSDTLGGNMVTPDSWPTGGKVILPDDCDTGDANPPWLTAGGSRLPEGGGDGRLAAIGG